MPKLREKEMAEAIEGLMDPLEGLSDQLTQGDPQATTLLVGGMITGAIGLLSIEIAHLNDILENKSD